MPRRYPTVAQRTASQRHRDAEHAGAEHLTARYSYGDYLSKSGLVDRVTGALRDSAAGAPTADAADMTAALALINAVRSRVDYQELTLIAHARAFSVPWPDIAVALGKTTPAAAQDRYRRLLRTYPGYYPPRPDVARWAVQAEGNIRAAATAVLNHRDAVIASTRAFYIGTAELRALAAAMDEGPVTLYWVAYTAVHGDHITNPDTDADRAVAALWALVTDPQTGKAPRR